MILVLLEILSKKTNVKKLIRFLPPPRKSVGLFSTSFLVHFLSSASGRDHKRDRTHLEKLSDFALLSVLIALAEVLLKEFRSKL